jgi:hypothetical protein
MPEIAPPIGGESMTLRGIGNSRHTWGLNGTNGVLIAAAVFGFSLHALGFADRSTV